jgi:hypothetical protein
MRLGRRSLNFAHVPVVYPGHLPIVPGDRDCIPTCFGDNAAISGIASPVDACAIKSVSRSDERRAATMWLRSTAAGLDDPALAESAAKATIGTVPYTIVRRAGVRLEQLLDSVVCEQIGRSQIVPQRFDLAMAADLEEFRNGRASTGGFGE